MRNLRCAILLVLLMYVSGTVGHAVDTSAQSLLQLPPAVPVECYYDFELETWMCPCDPEQEECEPPNCVRIGDEWHCPQNR